MKKHDDSHGSPDKVLSRLYREGDQPEPSAALDAAILGAARNAAEDRPQVRPAKGGLPHWRLPLALAATIVLSVVVTTLVRDELPPGTVAIPLPDASPPGLATESAAASASTRTAPQRQEKESLARPAIQPVAPTTHEGAIATAEAPAAASARMRDLLDRGAQPVLQAAPANQGAMAAGMAGTAIVPAIREDKAVSVMAAPRVLEKRAFSSTLREEAPLGTVIADERSAEAWLAEIRELKRAGRATEAAGKLAEFRKRFPEYKLPDDLK